MIGLKKKLAALEQVDAAPAATDDPLDRLAAKANGGAPGDIVDFKVRCTRGFLHTLDRVASQTRYRRNGLVKLLLEIGLAEYEARLKTARARAAG
jgi:hypothetical protein